MNGNVYLLVKRRVSANDRSKKYTTPNNNEYMVKSNLKIPEV